MYGLGKRLLIQAMGGRVKTVYDSPLRSLRPCWTAFLNSLRNIRFVCARYTQLHFRVVR